MGEIGLMDDSFSEFVNVRHDISWGTSRDTLFVSSRMNLPKSTFILPIAVTALPFILGELTGIIVFLGLSFLIILAFYYIYKKIISHGFYNGVIHIQKDTRVIEKSQGLKVLNWNVVELDEKHIIVQDVYTKYTKYNKASSGKIINPQYDTYFRIYLIPESSLREEDNRNQYLDNILDNLIIFTENLKIRNWPRYEPPPLPKDAILLYDNRSFEMVKVISRFLSLSLDMTIFDMIPDNPEYITPEDANKNLIEKLDRMGYSKDNILRAYSYIKKPKGKCINELRNGILLKQYAGNLKTIKIITCSILFILTITGISISSFNPIGLTFTILPIALLFVVILLKKVIMLSRDGVRSLFTIFDYHIGIEQFIPIEELLAVQDVGNSLFFVGKYDNIMSSKNKPRYSEYAEKAVKRWLIQNLEYLKNHIQHRKTSKKTINNSNFDRFMENKTYLFTKEKIAEEGEESGKENQST